GPAFVVAPGWRAPMLGSVYHCAHVTVPRRGLPGRALVAVGGAGLVMRSCRAAAAAGWLLVAAAGAIVGPALLIGVPLVRYRVPADPIFIIWMVAGVQAVRRAHVAHASATLKLNSIGRPRGGASS